MNVTLRERLIRAEQQFLLAIIPDDEDSLKCFSQEWSQLAHELEGVIVAGRLDDNTALLLSEVSRAIENLTVCMLESKAMLQEIRTCSIDDIMQDTPLSDPPVALRHSQAITQCRLLFSNLPSSMTPKLLGQQQLLDSYAYHWLMQNIHDPYPNSVQARIIGDVSGTSVAQVELWFQEVRDAIGWSKLSCDFFAGSVNATIAAARRVYLERDRDVSFDVAFAFTAVKAFADVLFSEHQPLQGTKVDTESAWTNRTTSMDQDPHMGHFTDKAIIDFEGVLVPPQIDPPAPLDLLSDLSDSDESEEDTTPPPSVAGCKRSLAEDELTSHVYELGRPQKRRRSESMNCTPSSELESHLPSPSISGSSEQNTPCNSAMLISPSSSCPLSPTPPESLPAPSSSIPQRRENAELNEDALVEGTVSSLYTQISTHGVRKRRLSQNDSLVASKRQCRPIMPPTGHSSVKPMSSSHSCPDLSLPRGRPSDFDTVLRPTLPALVNPSAPVNFGVFDWNSISDPSAATASSMAQPSIVYAPISDLQSQLLEPPDFGHDVKTGSSSFVDLGSLEDFGSSLQFPIPAGLPDLSTVMASPYLDTSSFPPQDFDLSMITEFIDSFPSGSTSSLSPSSSSSTLATPGSPQESFSPSESCDPIKQPSTVLDSSVPPSVFLPFESGAFSEDMNNMWSFLHDVS